MTIKDLKCDCCGSNEYPIAGTACIPGMPISILWCVRCLNAGIVPYEAAVTNTAMCGGFVNAIPEWKSIVEKTLDFFKKTEEFFLIDVAKEMAEMKDDETNA